MEAIESISPCWKDALSEEFSKPYFKSLCSFLEDEYRDHIIYPNRRDIFRALEKTPLSRVKVVILGQDPYHGANQANGLAFSVNDGMKFPPSLRNIFKEIESDVDIAAPLWGNLDRWADQGVFLLNATLTVRAENPGSHQNQGWEEFTDAIIDILKQQKNKVYLLWGSFAQKKAKLIDTSSNLVLTSPHPSPLSAYRGFFGNQHFSKANAYLSAKNLDSINW